MPPCPMTSTLASHSCPHFLLPEQRMWSIVTSEENPENIYLPSCISSLHVHVFPLYSFQTTERDYSLFLINRYQVRKLSLIIRKSEYGCLSRAWPHRPEMSSAQRLLGDGPRQGLLCHSLSAVGRPQCHVPGEGGGWKEEGRPNKAMINCWARGGR